MDLNMLRLTAHKQKDVVQMFSDCESSDLHCFPQNEIEGIKDCYVYTDEPIAIYSEIARFLYSNSVDVSCHSIHFDASSISDGVTFSTTITLNDAHSVEFKESSGCLY